MTVFEIIYPGTWLKLQNQHLAFTLQVRLSTVESRFSDAAMALYLFERAQKELLAGLSNHADQPREDTIQAADIWELASKYGTDGHAFQLELSKRTLEAKRNRWRAGELPQAYIFRLPFLYARTFLFSLWDIRRLLGYAVKCHGVPAGAAAAVREFDVALPSLKALRHSSAHVDERATGKAHGHQIALKPIETHFINAPAGGVLVIESLEANRFIGTTADGDLAEIEVSADTMKVVQRCFQLVLNSLSWVGSSRHYPD